MRISHIASIIERDSDLKVSSTRKSTVLQTAIAMLTKAWNCPKRGSQGQCPIGYLLARRVGPCPVSSADCLEHAGTTFGHARTAKGLVIKTAAFPKRKFALCHNGFLALQHHCKEPGRGIRTLEFGSGICDSAVTASRTAPNNVTAGKD
jgi:hypothetical protein